MVFLGALELARGEFDRMIECRAGLCQLPLHLPGGAEIGGNGEVIGMIGLGRAKDRHGLGGVAEPNVDGAEVGLLVRAELAVARRLFELVGRLQIALARGIDRRTLGGLHGDGAKHALVEEEAAPLRGERRDLFLRVVQSRPRCRAEA